MDLASLIVLGAVYVGYNMTQEDRPTPKKLRKNVKEHEKPNGKNVYHSEHTQKVDSKVKQAGTKAFEGARLNESQWRNNSGTEESNWVSPFYNQDIFGKDLCNDADCAPQKSILPQTRKLNDSELLAKKQSKSKSIETKMVGFEATETLDALPTQRISKLSGEPLEMAHNNMVPFFGPKALQNIDPNRNSTLIEKFTGKEETPVRKQEVPYMFKPEKGRGNVFGSGLFTSKIDRSRYAQSNKKHNILPMAQVKEAALPAELVRPQYKNVDQLRIGTNHKLEYKARRVDGIRQSQTQRGVVGHVNKNRPDKFYINNPDRYFTAPSHIKKAEYQGAWTRKDFNKSNIAESQENVGPAFSMYKESMPRYKAEGSEGTALDSVIRNPFKETFKNDYTRNVGVSAKDVDDYGLCSYAPREQERETTSKLHVLNVAQPGQGEYIGYEDTQLGIKNTPKTTNKEINLYDRKGNANSIVPEGMDYREYYNNQRFKQELDNPNYLGVASSGGQSEQKSRSQYETHRVKSCREEVVDRNNRKNPKQRRNIPRDPSSYSICQRDETVFESARPYGNGVVPKYTDVTEQQQCGDNTKKQCQTVYKDPKFERISSVYVDAFKSNPYTQSLNSI